jgi:hypothetical protein
VAPKSFRIEQHQSFIHSKTSKILNKYVGSFKHHKERTAAGNGFIVDVTYIRRLHTCRHTAWVQKINPLSNYRIFRDLNDVIINQYIVNLMMGYDETLSIGHEHWTMCRRAENWHGHGEPKNPKPRKRYPPMKLVVALGVSIGCAKSGCVGWTEIWIPRPHPRIRTTTPTGCEPENCFQVSGFGSILGYQTDKIQRVASVSQNGTNPSDSAPPFVLLGHANCE